jgi:hypothetical protein
MGKYQSEPIEILAIDSHRNGIGGNRFHVVLFETSDVPDEKMLAIVFPEDGNIAVIGLGMAYEHNNVAFGSNSYRYEFFEDELRKAVKDYDKGMFEEGE